ncbi:transposase family protein [Streptomyces sp. NPDC058326]|uniref:transposase family protein n=1 Tax=Streptomyces sp. NPDC058326 TaxID=3346447 RepID=UPI0036EB46BC
MNGPAGLPSGGPGVVAGCAAVPPGLGQTCAVRLRLATFVPGGEVVLIDGTLPPTLRRTGKDNKRNYSGKHRRHGLHFLALTDEKGRLIWISAARAGATHDITAARRDDILSHLREADLGALGDLGFLGLDTDPENPVVITGFKAARARKLTPGMGPGPFDGLGIHHRIGSTPSRASPSGANWPIRGAS